MSRDPEYLEFMRRRLAEPAEPGRGVAHARRAHAADLARSPRLPVGAVKDLRVDGAAGPLPARLYLPAAGAPAAGGPAPALVYFHGGGWILGDVDSYDPVVRALTRASGVAWVSVGYRRPPEDPYPAAVDDAVAAVRWVAARAAALGLDPARIGVAGDSAGGQIAAAAAGRLRAPGPARPALQVLLYPALDLRRVPPPLPDPDGLRFPPSDAGRALRAYLNGADPAHPGVSPLLDPDPRGLPRRSSPPPSTTGCGPRPNGTPRGSATPASRSPSSPARAWTTDSSAGARSRAAPPRPSPRSAPPSATPSPAEGGPRTSQEGRHRRP